MSGEKHLDQLLATMSPVLLEGEFVFLTFASAVYGDHAKLQPIAMFTESEGLTLVVPKSSADEFGFPYSSIFRAITLEVHSSLDAVGLTAAISGKLTEQGISANVLAAYYHDHIFVPRQDADNAIKALGELSGKAQEYRCC